MLDNSDKFFHKKNSILSQVHKISLKKPRGELEKFKRQC